MESLSCPALRVAKQRRFMRFTEINKPDINIVTVEDPVEYTMQGINQVNVNTKANMTFATAPGRSCVRILMLS